MNRQCATNLSPRMALSCSVYKGGSEKKSRSINI
jgi:hypothetical protein